MTDNTELNEIKSQEETNVNAQEQEETLNNEPEIDIPEPIPNPWDNAPEGLVYYEKMYEDGHLGSFTKSAELAYKFGWFENSISESDLKVSDINGWTYRKDVCPMKTEQDLLKDQYRLEITQLKKQLSDTDYKAIKYAEGQLTEEEYSPTRSQRASWRARINKLQEDFNI